MENKSNKNEAEAKRYLESYLRLKSYGQVGKLLSPEAKQFQKEKYDDKNPEFKFDSIMSWLIKKALSHL